MLETQLEPRIKKPKVQSSATALADRIIMLDVLRGFALLGILAMNIQSFGQVTDAYTIPGFGVDFLGIHVWLWRVTHVVADSKFMSLFSMLFGAGVVLFSANAERKGKPATLLHYRRNVWLFIFGCIHAYALWYGDILTAYASCAFIVYWARNWEPPRLLIVAFILLAIPSIMMALGTLFPEVVEETGGFYMMRVQEVQTYRGGWLTQMDHRIPTSLELQIWVFWFYAVWRVSGLMLIGMAFYKLGILQGRVPDRRYWSFILGALVIGYPLTITGLYQISARDWDILYLNTLGGEWNYWGSLLIAWGYIGMIGLIVKHGQIPWLTRRLAAVGQMAFTNYIMHSVLGMAIFYGNGLGQFQRLPFGQLLLITLGIWVLQLLLSPVWLHYYRFGPLEWLWRSLTYGQFQPMRRVKSTSST